MGRQRLCLWSSLLCKYDPCADGTTTAMEVPSTMNLTAYQEERSVHVTGGNLKDQTGENEFNLTGLLRVRDDPDDPDRYGWNPWVKEEKLSPFAQLHLEHLDDRRVQIVSHWNYGNMGGHFVEVTYALDVDDRMYIVNNKLRWCNEIKFQ